MHNRRTVLVSEGPAQRIKHVRVLFGLAVGYKLLMAWRGTSGMNKVEEHIILYRSVVRYHTTLLTLGEVNV
jgi:hypothetical protein